MHKLIRCFSYARGNVPGSYSGPRPLKLSSRTQLARGGYRLIKRQSITMSLYTRGFKSHEELLPLYYEAVSL